MSSPISFSGFNNIDFSVIVTSLMAQASEPLTTLQNKQSALQTKQTQVSSFISQVSLVHNAVSSLSTASALASFTASSSDSSSASVSATSQSAPGHYDVVVKELARAQVTASDSTSVDANTTVVATGGTLTIGGANVAITHDVTLQGLADAINAKSDAPVRASVVQTDAGKYRLVLTSHNSGTANAFTITNTLSGGAGVTFTDTDADGVSGDSVEDNAVQATNALALVNNVEIVSSSNTLTTAITGATLTLSKKDPLTTIGIDVTADSSALKSKLSSFITAYNGLMSFSAGQDKSAASGDASSLGHDPLLRSLRSGLRSTMTSSYANSGPLKYLSEIGVEFTRTGTLQLNNATFNSAVASGTGNAAKVAAGSGSGQGAFGALGALLDTYTGSGGALSTERTQITTQISSLGRQIISMQARLDQQRQSLQAEFTAADLAMSRLSSQGSSLGQLSTAKA